AVLAEQPNLLFEPAVDCDGSVFVTHEQFPGATGWPGRERDGGGRAVTDQFVAGLAGLVGERMPAPNMMAPGRHDVVVAVADHAAHRAVVGGKLGDLAGPELVGYLAREPLGKPEDANVALIVGDRDDVGLIV